MQTKILFSQCKIEKSLTPLNALKTQIIGKDFYVINILIIF